LPLFSEATSLQKLRSTRFRGLAALLTAACGGTSTPGVTPPSAAPRLPVELSLERALPLDISDDFQPSGLVLRDGRLLTVSDKHDTGVYEIVLAEGHAALRSFVTFTPPREEPSPLDFEGIAVDADGSLLLVSETRFRVLRIAVAAAAWITPSLEALGRGAGLFQKKNANLEGIVRLPGGRLLLAAERDPRGLIELAEDGDLTRAKAWAMPESVHTPPPGRTADFADLSVAQGNVYALQRNSHLIVRIERTDERWEEREAWSYARTENDPRFAYESRVYGVAEGLAIDGDHVFVVTDNNGLARAADPHDRRPLLFVFARPRR
jgi:uncharacterized protein YjiK